LAVIWLVEWDGITEEQFADLQARTQWVTNPPDGLEHQVVAFSNKSLVLTQVWKSPEHVMRFMEDRLLPAVRAAGIKSMPRVDQYPVHSVFSSNGS
jgi:hypothetical protein